MTPAAPPLPPVFGVLDIGNAKVACIVLARADDGRHRVVGAGHQVSSGVKASTIADADAAEEVLRATVDQAQQMAGVEFGQVVIGAACGRLGSLHLTVGAELKDSDGIAEKIAELSEAARAYAERGDRTVLHSNPVVARLDGTCVPFPIAVGCGRHLALDLNVVAADRTPILTLRHLAERCRLDARAIVPAPLASAIAVTTPKERMAGVLVIDCGAGSTGLAAFVGGVPVLVHAFAVGSSHMTYDIARALDVPVAEAERIKRICAIIPNAHPADDGPDPSDPSRGVSPAAADAAVSEPMRARISTILTSRADALLVQVGDKLAALGLAPRLGTGVVLTGGGSGLGGLAAHAGKVLGLPTRAPALPVSELIPAPLRQASFATVAGLIDLAMNAPVEFAVARPVAREKVIAAAGERRRWGRIRF